MASAIAVYVKGGGAQGTHALQYLEHEHLSPLIKTCEQQRIFILTHLKTFTPHTDAKEAHIGA